MFTASDGCVLIGSDFSQQEPKLLTYYTQDKAMLDAYAHNKDLYAQIASLSFHRKYEDCLEFYPEGTVINHNGKEVVCGHKTHTNKEGKEYRNKAKSVLLGIMYGRGAQSIAEQLHCSTKEANEIINGFYRAFPTVKSWSDNTVEFARKNGYVETFYGRRRYIKNITLPDYEFSYIDNKPRNFNPLAFDVEDDYTDSVDEKDIIKYTRLLNDCVRYTEKEGIKQRAFAEGIKIHDNGGYLSEAIRQCVNSRIQGGAADQSKLAMINIGNCQELKDLGFKLLIGVHDELIGEAPIENAKRCGDLLSECMRNAASDILKLPAKCDVSITKCWYGEEIEL